MKRTNRMKTITKILLLISHILISLFTIWGAMLERALIARPDLPESVFWYHDVLIGTSCVILFVLPFLLFLNLRWYRIIGLICYVLISLFWYIMIYSMICNFSLYLKLGHLVDFFDITHVFYLLCILFYFYPLVFYVKSIIQQSLKKN